MMNCSKQAGRSVPWCGAWKRTEALKNCENPDYGQGYNEQVGYASSFGPFAMSEAIIGIVEARMTSSRLPGKVLLPAAGRPLLEHLVRRLRAAPSISRIVVATTANAAD